MKSSVVVPDPDLRDSARRATDEINNWYYKEEWQDLKNKFVAVKLADGTTDGVLYDSKPDAVRHQHGNENQYAYICFRNLGPSGPVTRELAIVLQVFRNAYAKGHRMADPSYMNAGPDIAITSGLMDAVAPTVYAKIATYDMHDLAELRAQLGLA